MPMVSESQRRWMWARKPGMARRWERETPGGKKLPEKVAGIVPKKALVAAGALAVPYAVGRKVQQRQRQQEHVMNKSAVFAAGVSSAMSKFAYYQTHEDVIEDQADRLRQRAREHTADVRAVGAGLGAATGALAGLAANNSAHGALFGAAAGTAIGAALSAPFGRIIGSAIGKGQGRLATKLDSLTPGQRREYLKELVRDRMAAEQMENEIAASHPGRTRVHVY